MNDQLTPMGGQPIPDFAAAARAVRREEQMVTDRITMTAGTFAEEMGRDGLLRPGMLAFATSPEAFGVISKHPGPANLTAIAEALDSAAGRIEAANDHIRASLVDLCGRSPLGDLEPALDTRREGTSVFARLDDAVGRFMRAAQIAEANAKRLAGLL